MARQRSPDWQLPAPASGSEPPGRPARVVIKNRNVLRRLGFLQRRRSADSVDDGDFDDERFDDGDVEDDIEEDADDSEPESGDAAGESASEDEAAD